jgi:hypothetical protein
LEEGAISSKSLHPDRNKRETKGKQENDTAIKTIVNKTFIKLCNKFVYGMLQAFPPIILLYEHAICSPLTKLQTQTSH